MSTLKTKLNHFVFFLLFIQITLIYNQFVKIPFVGHNFFIEIHLILGENKYNEIVPLNFYNPYTWISNYYLKNTNFFALKQFGNNRITIGKENLTGFIYEDVVSFKDSSTSFDWMFYTSNITSYYSKDAGIGLAYTYKGNNIDEFSIAFQLKKKQLTDKAEFSIVCENDYHYHGSLYFGSIPYDLIKNSYKTSCRVSNNGNDQFWKCDLNNLIIRTDDNQRVFKYNLIKNHNQIIWNSVSNYNYIPLPVFDLFTQFFDIGNEKQENSQCSVRNIQQKKVIECSKSTNSAQYKNVELVLKIDRTNFILNYTDIFECPENKLTCLCLYAYDSTLNDNDNFYFSYAFFHKYITTFDYENKQIVFYSKTPFSNMGTNNQTIIISLSFCNFILLIFGCILVLFNTKNKHNI